MSVEMRGALSHDRLVEVLRSLKESQFYGTFLVSDGLREKCFFFTRGGLRLATSGHDPISISDYLFSLGQLSGEAAHKLAQQAAEGKEVPKAELAAKAGVEVAVIEDAERQLMAEEFWETLFWASGHFEFKAGDPDEQAYQAGLSTRLLSLGVKDLVDRVIERAMTMRDMRRRIPSTEVQVAITGSGREQARRDLGPTQVLREMGREPRWTIRDLADRLIGWSEFRLVETLLDAADQGWVELLGEDQEGEERVLERIRRLEEGLDEAISPIMKRQALARGYEEQNDKVSAAQHYKRAGLLMIRDRREGDASKELRQACDLDPEDFEAQEGLVDALWASRQTEAARGEAEQLSRRYFDLGLSNRARLVLERAMEKQTGKDLELQNMLVRAYLRLGRSDKALELGRDLCDDLRAVGRVDEAMSLAERFMDAGVDAERVLAMAGEQKRRRLKLILQVSAGVLLLLLIPSAVAARGRMLLAEASEGVRESLAKGDYEEARSRLERLRAQASFGIRGELIALESQVNDLDRLHAHIGQLLAPWYDVKARRIDWRAGPSIAEAEDALSRLAKDPPVGGPLFRDTYAALQRSLAAHEKEAQRLREAFQEAYRSGEARRCFELGRRYFKDYTNVPEVRSTFVSIGLPVLLRTEPPGAQVEGLARKVKTSGDVFYVPVERREVTIRLKGYKTQTLIVHPLEVERYDLPVVTLTAEGGE